MSFAELRVDFEEACQRSRSHVEEATSLDALAADGDASDRVSLPLDPDPHDRGVRPTLRGMPDIPSRVHRRPARETERTRRPPNASPSSACKSAYRIGGLRQAPSHAVSRPSLDSATGDPGRSRRARGRPRTVQWSDATRGWPSHHPRWCGRHRPQDPVPTLCFGRPPTSEPDGHPPRNYHRAPGGSMASLRPRLVHAAANVARTSARLVVGRAEPALSPDRR